MTNGQNRQKTNDDVAVALKVSAVSIFVNLILSAFKLVAGIFGHSAAMVSDAIHSASDVFSTFVVIIGVKIAGKDSDREHPYGHERMESVAAFILAVVLALTGLGIGWSGVTTIIAGNYDNLAVPTIIPLIAAVASIVVKEWMYWFTRAAAKKINSDALMADAWHHRSDSLSSIGSLVGIVGARLGLPILDPVASVVICLFILKAAYEIFREAISKMVDHSCDNDTIEKMKALVLEDKDVLVLDDVKTRLFGSRIYVDVEISADGSKTLFETHEIAQRVHDEIEQNFPTVKHCMVHVNPAQVKKQE